MIGRVELLSAISTFPLLMHFFRNFAMPCLSSLCTKIRQKIDLVEICVDDAFERKE